MGTTLTGGNGDMRPRRTIYWMARAIIRWSIEGEKSNATGNAIRSIVEPIGFTKVGTASWEGNGDARSLLKVLNAVLQTLHDVPGGGEVDHVWIYLDTAKC